MIIKGVPIQSALAPNRKAHWTVKARATKQLRGDAYLCAVAARGESWAMFNYPTIAIHWYTKDKRRHDPDNALRMVKPAIDGIVDAGLIRNDKYVEYLPIKFVVDKEKGGTVDLEIREGSDGEAQKRQG